MPPTPRAFDRPACTLFETFCMMRPSQIFNTAQTMVNDGLALHKHPAQCHEFWTGVMEVAKIQLHDDHLHATIHSFLEDVPRSHSMHGNVPESLRVVPACAVLCRLVLAIYTPRGFILCTATSLSPCMLCRLVLFCAGLCWPFTRHSVSFSAPQRG